MAPPQPVDAPEEWTSALLKTMKAKMKELTGREQIKGFGGVYFIPSLPDLKSSLDTFQRQYRNHFDREKIEKCLLQHMQECFDKKSWAPATKYFIVKKGSGSQLSAAIENYEEEENVQETSNQRFI